MSGTSVRIRLIKAFASFGILLALFYWALIYSFLLLTEDEIFNRKVGQELTYQLDYYDSHGSFDKLPRNMYFYTNDTVAEFRLPEQLQAVPNGVTEINGKDVHISAALHPSGEGRLFIVYEVATEEIDDAMHGHFMLICFAAFLSVVLAAVTVGFWFGLRLVRPLERLEKRVLSVEVGDAFGEVQSFGEDEVGRLASAFASTHDRNTQFLDRERRFTREVSHELRTPVAVLQGALDILHLKPGHARAMQRIERATRELKELIETFLLLSREGNTTLSDDHFETGEVLRTIIESVEEKARVPILLEVSQEPGLNVLPSVYAVLARNLIDNAARHTEQGQINVSQDKQSLVVTDSGCGMPAELIEKLGAPWVESSGGQGLGLSIVQRICQQHGWQLKVESEQGSGTRIEIGFS